MSFGRILLLKEDMRDRKQTVRPSFMKMFFRLAERGFRDYGDSFNIAGFFEDLRIIDATVMEDLPPAVTEFNRRATRLLLSAIKDSIQAVVDDDVAEVERLENSIGGVVPAGSLDPVWRRFATSTDTDSARKCIMEMVRLLHLYSNERANKRITALMALMGDIEEVITSIRE